MAAAKSDRKDEKAARLAAALRANLRRRKAQTRGRAQDEVGGGASRGAREGADGSGAAAPGAAGEGGPGGPPDEEV